MKGDYKIVKNRSMGQMITSLLLMTLFAALHLTAFFAMSAVMLFISVILYFRTPQHILMKVYRDRLELFDEHDHLANEIWMENIIAWRWSGGTGRTVEIYYREPEGSDLLCTITSPNSGRVATLLNKAAKEKNQNLEQYCSPYRVMGDKIFRKRKRVDKNAHS